jgi:hypothetical protein
MRRAETQKLRFVRLAWGDTHGYSQAKTLTIPGFQEATFAWDRLSVC